MSGQCSTHGAEEPQHKGISGKPRLRQEDDLKNPLKVAGISVA